MNYLLPLLFVLATVLIMFVLIRRRVLKERFTVWWAVLSLGVIVFAIFPPLLPFVATSLGFQTPSNFVFFAASLMFLLMSVQFSVEISRLDEKTRTLAEQLGILRTQMEQHISATDSQGADVADDTSVDGVDA